MSLRVGVLLIGSLYWDNNQREQWRNSHLNRTSEFSVSVPIRYGHLATKRDNTYTMVFSRLCLNHSHGMGSAIAISLRSTINTCGQLIQEAEYLWAAERHKSQSDGHLSADWGCVALLINPASQISQDLLEGWPRRISQENHYEEFGHTKSEEPCITPNGFLNIPWPRLLEDDTLLPMDMLLAIATSPTLTDGSMSYPRIREITHAWRRSDQVNEDYFWRNYESGIHTYQDDTIKGILKQRRGA
jgi:hypothetical protein